KRNFCFLLLLLLSLSSFSQDTRLSAQQITSLTTLGELWGFFKYYHPHVAKGKWNWDSVLIAKLPEYLNAKNKQSLSTLTNNWIQELGNIDSCKRCYQQVPDSLGYNLDFSWINEKCFTKDVVMKLNFIRANRNIGSHHYVEYQASYKSLLNFKNEKVYNDTKFVYPPAEYRIVTLFRHWNWVHYFFPYKHLIGKDWKKVLQEMVPAFYEAKDTLSYHKALLKLTASLEDGHSRLLGLSSFYVLGEYYPVPFLCMLIDDQFVVSSLSNDSAASAIRIKKGDVLIEVNGESVYDRYKRLAPYVQASNEGSKAMFFAASYLFRGSDSVFTIKKIRGKQVIIDTIQFSKKVIPFSRSQRSWKLLADSIGYVDMGILQKTEVDKMMKELMATKGIIFDLRNYPHGTWNLIAAYLCKQPFVMSRISYPDLDYPGVFLFENPAKYGNTNDNPYTGKVVLLVDESAVSHAEYSAMGLQAATQTITIGNTTAGMDGNITNRLWLPGGLFTQFSGTGVYYPDGTVTQRKGVRIDYYVRPTIKGLQAGRDEVLEAAVSYITTNK
ncbi:MAG TPA: S41 family peptidase, partial [Flavisolibacter sp.]|nr:S41 family peptidase [Flavisolibacter sp.]